MKKPQLFLLHFAGGNCYSFNFMLPHLKEFEVVTIELPGRGRRIMEDLLKDFDSAALDVYKQIRSRIGSAPYLIYGHSMGAHVGLRVANLLCRAGYAPAYLVVSGNAGPSGKKKKFTYLLGKRDFISHLRKLGGISSEVIENDELFSVFEPILRADFELVERSEIAGEPPLGIPIYAVMGTEESRSAEIGNWANYTYIHFDYEILSGDHFFIHKHPGRIADIVKECYARAVAATPAGGY